MVNGKSAEEVCVSVCVRLRECGCTVGKASF